MTADFLAKVPLFSTLEPPERSLLSGLLKQKRLAPQEVLFRESDRADACYVVVTGRVLVEQSGASGGAPQHLATLGPGSLVGELALIDGGPRSATVRADREPAVLLVLGRDDFERVFRADQPFAFKILDRLVIEICGRLRRATERLALAAAKAPRPTRTDALDAAGDLHGASCVSIDLGGINLDDITFEGMNTSKGLRRTRG